MQKQTHSVISCLEQEILTQLAQLQDYGRLKYEYPLCLYIKGLGLIKKQS